MQVLDVTEEVDFTRTNTVQAVIDSIKRLGDVFFFFYSSPCTGGSTWQFVNAARGAQTDPLRV
eukprot:9149698-Lingulodinium_polyedra.AAC.1